MNIQKKYIGNDAERPIYLLKAREIFSKIKILDINQTKSLYKLSDKKSEEVYNAHQEHGKTLYYAFDLYDGLFYKKLNWTVKDKEWINEHIIILDALYGIIKPFDTIAPYRLDFKIKFPMNLKNFWKQEINDYLKDYKIYNLASQEFSSLIDKPIHSIPLSGIGNIKIQRAEALNSIIQSKNI